MPEDSKLMDTIHSTKEGLPFEVLSSILKACLAIDGDYRSGNTPAVVFTIIQVCTVWHEVALLVPEFWKTVKINRQLAASDKDTICGIESWVARAINHPISLSLNLRTGEFRILHLAARIPWVQLTSFELNDCGFGPREALDFLRQCPNLVSVHLARIDGAPVQDIINFRQIFTLPALKNLVVEFRSTTHLASKDRRQRVISPLFKPLTLPSLTELEIRAHHSAVDHDLLPNLLLIHARSHFPLTRLHLADIIFDVEELQTLLARLPTLVELHLEAKPMYHSFADLLPSLQYSGSGKSVLPRLETLFIADNVFPDEWEDADEAALAMLESRRWKEFDPAKAARGLSALKNATVKWSALQQVPPYANEGGSRRSAALLEQGLQLSYPTLL